MKIQKLFKIGILVLTYIVKFLTWKRFDEGDKMLDFFVSMRWLFKYLVTPPSHWHALRFGSVIFHAIGWQSGTNMRTFHATESLLSHHFICFLTCPCSVQTATCQAMWKIKLGQCRGCFAKMLNLSYFNMSILASNLSLVPLSSWMVPWDPLVSCCVFKMKCSDSFSKNTCSHSPDSPALKPLSKMPKLLNYLCLSVHHFLSFG